MAQTILVVDDDEHIRSPEAKILERYGLSSRSGNERAGSDKALDADV
jgi:DNA-binding NtrC family response regulator